MSVFTLVSAWMVFCITCFMLCNFKIFSLMSLDLSDTSSGPLTRFIVYSRYPCVMSHIPSASPSVLFIITSSMMGSSVTFIYKVAV